MTTPLDLLGRWRLERTVADRLAGETLHVAGTAVLEPTDGGSVRWHERGVLRRPGAAAAEVSRTLLAVPPDPDRGGRAGPEAADPWQVTFADGRPFHPWLPGVEVEHRCPPDLYRGRVTLDVPVGWSVAWDVHGPAKSYAMLTRYRR